VGSAPRPPLGIRVAGGPGGPAFSPRVGERGQVREAALLEYATARARASWDAGQGAASVAAMVWDAGVSAHRARQRSVVGQYEACCQARWVQAWPATLLSVVDWLVLRPRAEARARNYYARLLGLLRTGGALLHPGASWALSEDEVKLLDAVLTILSEATPRSVPRRATPAVYSVLEQLAQHLRPQSAAPADRMVWVVLCVTVQAVTRSGTVVRLTWEDLAVEPDGTVLLRWAEEKTSFGRVTYLLPLEGLAELSGLQGSAAPVAGAPRLLV
jgi:hypothetical protein